MKSKVVILIPAFEPTDALTKLIKALRDDFFLVVVNDGSSGDFAHLFAKAEALLKGQGTLLAHNANRGKGAALKTGFAYIEKHCPDAVGVVTADCDGQHSLADIRALSAQLLNSEEFLYLGVRDFKGSEVPWKSKLGNLLTCFICRTCLNLNLSDTQTGLRAIPYRILRDLQQLSGNRFEFETQMLIQSPLPLREIPVRTIYQSRELRRTHFRTISDSLSIYRILFKAWLRRIA
ncbi:MAG: glycosyltransferase family 2 protein [Alphaproteobacteria bacterium]|nr:glycosyltransferase family 2 protein [Alphaproteobacteria bacterium]MBR1756339.1 glycosyltransferase family 2 protein [Alphaproteobacteria bacterium]